MFNFFIIWLIFTLKNYNGPSYVLIYNYNPNWLYVLLYIYIPLVFMVILNKNIRIYAIFAFFFIILIYRLDHFLAISIRLATTNMVYYSSRLIILV